MSELQLVTSIISTFFTIGSATLTGLFIRDEFNFNRYKSILANVRRYGMVLSLKHVRAAFYQNEISEPEVLQVFGLASSHTIDDSGQPMSRRDSPWSHTKVEMVSGNVRHPDFKNNLFGD